MGLFTEIELEAAEVPSAIKGSKEKGRAEGVGKGLARILFHQSELGSCWGKVFPGLG